MVVGKYVEDNKNENIVKLIKSRIENLRPKLLDLTRRNPLLSVKYSDRSNSYIRVVDEVLSALFARLSSGEIKIVPLPALEEDPKDELSREFLDALAEARLTDLLYLKALDEINQDDKDSANLLSLTDRGLKDRLREQLTMPPRQTKANTSVQQHALNHKINPSYDLLKIPEGDHHNDEEIQTLLLPDLLERRVNALYTKEKTWVDETGISVLHAAFGFLEWQENNTSQPSYAPLILLPVVLEKKRSSSGQVFLLNGSEDAPLGNTVLAEKLRLEFNIIIPEYTSEQPIDEYLELIAKQIPKSLPWKVRPWVTIGVFPSARLAMYYDLNTKLSTSWDFASHPVISALLGGSETGNDNTPFGDEYEVDDPEIEAKVPLLVTDADSSQFSVIADISDGKNLAVEGPPGTGKSQTIVNTIAAMLAKGKKILFVAEKVAALEVVRTRLEAFSLGEYILSLQATRSSKTQVIASIRERIEMESCTEPKELENKISQFKKARQEIKSYIDVLKTPFLETGLNTYQILGRSINLRKSTDSLPNSLKNYSFSDLQIMTTAKVDEIISICQNLEQAWLDTKQHPDWWKGITVTNLAPFITSDILKQVNEAAITYTKLVAIRETLHAFGIDKEKQIEKLTIFGLGISSLLGTVKSNHVPLALTCNSQEVIKRVQSFVDAASKLQEEREELETHIINIFEPGVLENVTRITELVVRYNIGDIADVTLDKLIDERLVHISKLTEAISFLYSASFISPAFRQLPIKSILAACELVRKLPRDALMLRSKELMTSDSKIIIEKAKKRTENLCLQQASLINKFQLTPLPDQNLLMHHLGILANSNIFSFFTPSYHKAKKFYIGLSKNVTFNKETAISGLKEFHKWLSDTNELFSDKNMLNILGLRFNKLETNFEPYIELFNYFAEIDRSFSELEAMPLKEFLRLGDNDSLLSLPQPPIDHPVRLFQSDTLASVEEQLRKFEDELLQVKAAIEDIKKATKHFHKNEGWNSDKLLKISNQLEKFLTEYNKHSTDQELEKLSGIKFDEVLSKKRDIENSLQLAIFALGLDKDLKSALIQTLQHDELDKLTSLSDSIIVVDTAANESLDKIAILTGLDIKTWLLGTHAENAHHLSQAANDKQGLISYARLNGLIGEFSEKGHIHFIKELLENYDLPMDVSNAFMAVYTQALAREVYKQFNAVLSRFDGVKLSSLRRQLADLDKQIIHLSRERLRAQLYHSANPPRGKGIGKKSELTEMALLKNETAKKQRYTPVRDLTERAGKSLIELKPCWMMSPLAVAQYIPQGTITFDLAIIDEASQMTPENAIGALIRAKQVMVVGDTNQLPPTDFFRKVLEDEEADEDEAVTEESILEMANATFKPARRLRWHYRSLHSGLIAFSNMHVYENDLVIFPSASENHSYMGVHYKLVENGLYSSGTNPVEAKAMVDAAIDFMINHSDLSLGIVTLNQKQRDLLLDEMNYAFEHNSQAVKYKERWEREKYGLEPFFIKNLENVQGDERDVIFIGTVYGAEKPGAPVMQRFGPINGVAGKRRLNVLFSRAKRRIVTFSSMRATDIKAEQDSNPGVYMLKCWLEYSASKMIERGTAIEREPDSDFERHVIQQIKSIGFEAIPQIGVSGYFIDIGVRHPSWPHGFIMGVECDGAAYHSSKSARDRDRLRQEVLEGRGWYLYRIWSTDWFEDPARETQKLKRVIEERLKQMKMQIG
ncbi:MAG: DUF4011 domain-containing protein [Rickettsiales bacterium]